MRAILTKMIEEKKQALNREIETLRDSFHDIRETADKYFSKERVDGDLRTRPFFPSSLLGDDKGWLKTAMDQSDRIEERIFAINTEIALLSIILEKAEMLETPAPFDLDKVISEICSRIRTAEREASRWPLKKDLPDKRFYEGRITALRGLLELFGFDANQIDNLVKKG